MALSSASKAVLVWVVPVATGAVGGGVVGHMVDPGGIYGWKTGVGIGLVAGLLTAVGLNEATKDTGTPAPSMVRGTPGKVGAVP